MSESIVGNVEFTLTTPEEIELFDRQTAAKASGDVTKADAEYQYEPNGDQRCAGCSMFVPGFPYPIDVAGYCTKVRSFKGPQGQIFPDGWCKFFKARAK